MIHSQERKGKAQVGAMVQPNVEQLHSSNNTKDSYYVYYSLYSGNILNLQIEDIICQQPTVSSLLKRLIRLLMCDVAA